MLDQDQIEAADRAARLDDMRQHQMEADEMVDGTREGELEASVLELIKDLKMAVGLMPSHNYSCRKLGSEASSCTCISARMKRNMEAVLRGHQEKFGGSK